MLERDESTMVLRENRFDCSDFPDSALIYYFLVQITAWSLWLNTLVQGFQRRRKTERNESSSTMFGKSDSDRWYSWNLVEKYYSSKRQWTSFSIKRLIQQMNDYNEIRPRKKKKKFVRSLRQEDNRGTIRATCAQYTLLTRNASGNWNVKIDVKIENCSSAPAKNWCLMKFWYHLYPGCVVFFTYNHHLI